MQAAAMQIIYKGVFQWFLKLIVGVQFTDCRFLKKEKQFIILANHNSHLDTLSLLTISGKPAFRLPSATFSSIRFLSEEKGKKIRSTIRSVRCLKPLMPDIH